MPSASSKTSQPTPQTNVSSDLLQEPLKNAVSVMEKKLRNLEKRKIKILDTKKKADKGGELNEDQKKALESFIVVESSLELVKELHKNMSALDSEYGKLLKKDQKRMKQAEAHQVEVNSKNKVAGVVEVQAILGAMTEEVRADFLSGSHSACQLTEDDLANLDSFYELVNVQVEEGTHKKLSEHINDVTEHLNKVVDGKAKPALENEITYKDIAEIVSKIRASEYFDKESTNGESEAAEEEEEVAVEETPEEVESQPEQPKDEEVQLDEAPVQEEAVTPPEPQAPEPKESAVDLPPEVKEISPEAEPLNFLGDSEISTPVEENQQAQLNPVSPEFVPRNSFAATTPEDNGTNDGWEQPPPAESDWKSVDNQSYNYRGRGGRGGRGFGRGRGRGGSGGGNYRGGNREGGYRGNNRGRGNGEYRGGRGGNRGSGEYRGGRGEYRGRGGNRGGRDNRQYQQQQAQQ